MTDIYGYAAAAPQYRAAGWMQVIPLPEGRKTPPPADFTGRSRKPVTDEQIQLWSQANPNANTGIVIPEGVLVLDIDAEQGPPGQGRRGERHQRTQPGAGRIAGHVEQHVARHRFAGTPPVLQGARRARVEGRRHRGGRHPAARPPVFRRMAKHPPLRRNVLLVHTQRLDHQPDPPISAIWLPCRGNGWIICANRSIRRRDQLLIP